jgi:hypothetical protein
MSYRPARGDRRLSTATPVTVPSRSDPPLYREGMHDELVAVLRRGDPTLADAGVETWVMFDDPVRMDPHARLGRQLRARGGPHS